MLWSVGGPIVVVFELVTELLQICEEEEEEEEAEEEVEEKKEEEEEEKKEEKKEEDDWDIVIRQQDVIGRFII